MKAKAKKTPVKTGTKQAGRDKKTGKFLPGVSGNMQGRPKGSSFLQEFRDVLAKVESEEGKLLLEHLIRKAFENDAVLIATVGKMLPQLKAVEMTSAPDSGKLSDEDAQQIIDSYNRRCECKECRVKRYEEEQGASDGAEPVH